MNLEHLRARALAYRAEDHLWPLQSESWYTGWGQDGRQMLALGDDVEAVVCWLGPDGRFLDSEAVAHKLSAPSKREWPCIAPFLREQFGYREGTIRVRPFHDRLSGVTVKAIPHWLESFILHPENTPEERRQGKAESLEGWITRRDTYVVEAWGNTFFIDSNDGHCTAS